MVFVLGKYFPAVNFSVMTSLYVIPTQAGIQITYWYNNAFMDSCFHGNDIKRGHHGKIYSKNIFGFGCRSLPAVFRDGFCFLCSLLALPEMRKNVYYGVRSYGGRESSLQVPCPTKRAVDGGDSARFRSIFLASSFFCSQAESAPTLVVEPVETHRH